MQTTHTPQQKVILCIDDDDDDSDLITTIIRDVDHTIHVLQASNGEEALQLLSSNEMIPSLILLDINMPVMGGKETLKRLKEHEQYQSIPVVVFTTSSNPSDEVFFNRYGVKVHTKPDKFQLMIEKIRQFLSEIL